MKNIYLFKTEDSGKYKIGLTKGNVKKRLKQLQTANGERLVLVYSYKTKFPGLIEKSLHRHYRDRHMIGEWFELNENDVKGFLKECRRMEQIFKTLSENN